MRILRRLCSADKFLRMDAGGLQQVHYVGPPWRATGRRRGRRPVTLFFGRLVEQAVGHF
jgi:hypothetical protein